MINHPKIQLEDNLNDLNRVTDILKIPTLATDFVTSICGEFIRAGSFRAVYEYNLDPNFVVKIEPLNGNRNFIEWKIWQEVQELTNDLAWVKDWYAPCKWLSPNGRILIMQRTTQRHDRAKPEKVPSFLWDIKDNNFGWIGSKFVCHDYGENFYAGCEYRKKFKKANW